MSGWSVRRLEEIDDLTTVIGALEFWDVWYYCVDQNRNRSGASKCEISTFIEAEVWRWFGTLSRREKSELLGRYFYACCDDDVTTALEWQVGVAHAWNQMNIKRRRRNEAYHYPQHLRIYMRHIATTQEGRLVLKDLIVGKCTLCRYQGCARDILLHKIGEDRKRENFSDRVFSV